MTASYAIDGAMDGPSCPLGGRTTWAKGCRIRVLVRTAHLSLEMKVGGHRNDPVDVVLMFADDLCTSSAGNAAECGQAELPHSANLRSNSFLPDPAPIHTLG